MIYITIDGIDTRIPVEGEEEVAITYSIADFRDLSKRQRTFSKTLKIAGSADVNRLFSHLYDIHYSSDARISPTEMLFSVHKKHRATLWNNDVPILRGVLKMLRIELGGVVSDSEQIRSNSIMYEMCLLSEIADVAARLKEFTLKDLDFSEYNHVLNHTNIRNSQIGTVIKNGISVSNFSGGIPLGWGYFYAPFFLGTKQTIDETLTGVNMPLCYYVKEIFIKIFEKIGLTVNSSFFSTPEFRRLLITGDLRYFNGTDVLLNPSLASVTNTFDDVEQYISFPTNDAIGGGWRYLFLFSNSADLLKGATIIANPNNVFSITSSGGIFSPIITGKYKFQMSVQFTPNVSVTGLSNTYQTQINVIWRKNGIVVKNDIINAPMNTTTTYNTVVEIQMSNSDTLTVEYLYEYSFDVNTTPPPPYNSDTRTFTFNVDNLSLSVTRSDIIATFNQPINISHYLPAMSAYEFVNGIMNMFNLMFGDVQDGVINIEPARTFYLSYSGDDWTMKLDDSKSSSVVPIASEWEHRKLKYKYASASDYLHNLYLTTYGYGYGDGVFDTGIDIATGEMAVTLPFSSLIPAKLPPPATPLVFGQIYNLHDGLIKPANISPVIFLYAGIKNGDWTLKDTDPISGLPVIDNYTSYPLCTHYDSDTNPSVDICYKTPETLFYTPTNITLNTLFWKYIQPYLIELLSEESKLVRCYIRLSEKDIAKINMRKPIMIDGVLFRVNKIVDYTPLATSVQCELLKVVDFKQVPDKNMWMGIDGGSNQSYKMSSVAVGNAGVLGEGILYISDKQGEIGVVGRWKKKLPIYEYYARITADPLLMTVTEDVVYHNSFPSYTWSYVAAGIIEISSASSFARCVEINGENVLRYDILSDNTVQIYYADSLTNSPIIIKVY